MSADPGTVLEQLRRELEAAGIGPDDWPYPGDTADGVRRNIEHRAEVKRIRESSGAYDAMRWSAAREWELWQSDPRNGTAVPPTPSTKRRAGRPPWTDELFHERYREAVDATTPPLTPARIAANLRMLDETKGTTPEYLATLRREHPTE